MIKKHTSILLFFLFKSFYSSIAYQEFVYPDEHESLQNLCKATMYKNKVSFLPLPPALRESVPANIYKQTLDYVLFDEIFNNPINPDIAKVKELLEAGANPDFAYPLSTFKKEGGTTMWKKTKDMRKAGLCILAIIAQQKEFNESTREVTTLLIQHGANINQKSGNDPYNPPYGKITPIEYAQQSGNNAFIAYMTTLNKKAHP